MLLKRLRLLGLIALPFVLFVPLNYLVQSRRPVKVDIGRVADKDQEVLSLHALARLMAENPRASSLDVVWQLSGQPGKEGHVTFDRQDNVVSFLPVPTKHYNHDRRCETNEFDALNWARLGKIPEGYCLGDNPSAP